MTLQQIRILIVEDEQVTALNIRLRLEAMGYCVTGVVISGEAAIASIMADSPDLVLLDIRLAGEMDGIQVAEQIRAQFGLPVIYLTAYGDQETLQRLKLTEPHGYILKPFEIGQLHSTIEIALYKHQQEQILRAREQWLTTTLKSIGDAVITTDKHGQITFMNPVAEHLTGWKQFESIGQEISQVFRILDERTRDVLENPVAIALSEGKTVGIGEHALLITKDQTEIPIDDSVAPIKDELGQIIGAVLVFHDIIERKQFETELATLNQALELKVQERTQELESRQREFVALAENSPDVIARYDQQLRHLYINPIIEQECGIPAADFIGKTLTEVGFSSELIEYWERCFRAVLTTGEPHSMEFNFLGPKGLQFYQALVVPEPNPNGAIASILSIVRNITERKQFETQLQASLNEKTVLLKEVHHRVKNNLQTISSLLRLQASSVNDFATLEILRESQNRVLTMAIVHETLYQSKSLAYVNFADYVYKLTRELLKSYDANLRQIQLAVEVARVELSPDVVVPCGLIINELVSNAFNHAFLNHQSGEIKISFTVHQDLTSDLTRYSLTVQDNGVGLPNDVDPQASPSLGLRLVYALARQLNARVEVDRDRGSRFTITFQHLSK